MSCVRTRSNAVSDVVDAERAGARARTRRRADERQDHAPRRTRPAPRRRRARRRQRRALARAAPPRRSPASGTTRRTRRISRTRRRVRGVAQRVAAQQRVDRVGLDLRAAHQSRLVGSAWMSCSVGADAPTTTIRPWTARRQLPRSTPRTRATGSCPAARRSRSTRSPNGAGRPAAPARRPGGQPIDPRAPAVHAAGVEGEVHAADPPPTRAARPRRRARGLAVPRRSLARSTVGRPGRPRRQRVVLARLPSPR